MDSKEEISLSIGSLKMMFGGKQVLEPVFQILGVKKLSIQNAERYQVRLSDRETESSCTILATQLNELVLKNKLIDNAIVKICRYTLSNAKNKKIIVILELEILKSEKVDSLYPIEGAQRRSETNESSSAPSAIAAAVNRVASNISPFPVVSLQRRIQQDYNIVARENIICTPIGALNPFKNRWIIKGKVVNKSPIKHWNNSRGKGKLFSFFAVDQSGDIRITAFTEFVDKFYEMLENEKVYYISSGNIKAANKEYNSTTHEYEIMINSQTEINECHEILNLPATGYSFKKISELADLPVATFFDVIGVTYKTRIAETFVAKLSGRELTRRNIDFIDDSKTLITLTLWGDEANQFNAANNSVIALKGVKIKEFNQAKYLSTATSTVMEINPNLPEAHRLRRWFSNECPKNAEFPSLSFQTSESASSIKLMSLAKAYEDIIKSDGNEKLIFKTQAFISGFRSDKAIYKSCVDVNCKKQKVIETENGYYECEKCGSKSSNFKHRMFMNLSLSDDNYTMWVSINDCCEEILGVTADDLAVLLDQNYRDEYKDVFSNSTYKEYMFTVKLNQEIFMNEKRVNGDILNVEIIDNAKETKRLLNLVRKQVNKKIFLVE